MKIPSYPLIEISCITYILSNRFQLQDYYGSLQLYFITEVVLNRSFATVSG